MTAHSAPHHLTPDGQPMTRDLWTRLVLEHLDPALGWNQDRALHEWWVDARSHSGLRLTPQARDLAHAVGMPSWRFPIQRGTNYMPRTMLILNSHLGCAYYLDLKPLPALELFGSREAVMFGLCKDINHFARVLSQ